MTIACPACGWITDGPLAIQESSFEWNCGACGRAFEVRIVFLPSRRVMDASAFVARVEQRLKDEGLSQTDLARLLGVTPAYVSTVLSGRRKISGALADRILAALRSNNSAS